MAHYGLLGRDNFSEATDDVRGATLYGVNDEKLGKIDDVIFDHSNGDVRYVVVDTGGWLSSKKFLVPTNRLRESGKHENDFSSELTKEQVEAFPPYDESDLKSEEKWGDYENRYKAKWETGPVMHRAETDRNITPTTEQLVGNRSSINAEEGNSDSAYRSGQEGVRPGRDETRNTPASTDRVVPAGTDSVVISTSAVGIGDRWDTFQARLRERRKEAVTGCSTCSIGPQTSRSSESADTWKKAV